MPVALWHLRFVVFQQYDIQLKYYVIILPENGMNNINFMYIQLKTIIRDFYLLLLEIFAKIVAK